MLPGGVYSWPVEVSLDKEEDVVFYATWEEEVNNVTYYLNDGTSAIFESYDVPFGYDLDVPAAPVREGYTFIGWNTDATATEALNLEGAKMPNNDLAYYAVWEINEYTVTFDSNEGTAGLLCCPVSPLVL